MNPSGNTPRPPRFTTDSAAGWIEDTRLICQEKPLDEQSKIIFGRFRKVNAFVAEEIMMECFRQAAFTIHKRHGYTGDGGVDGMVSLGPQLKYLVQVKRYTGYINPSDVEDFARLTISRMRRNQDIAGGFFIHSGKTGDLSRLALKTYKEIILISGQVFSTLILAPYDGLNMALNRWRP
jgi:restriction system protein